MHELPIRKQMRLKDYDYSQSGCYFITICTKERKNILSEISPDAVGADIIRPQLTGYGEIADRAINAIPIHYPNFKIGTYMIMPDHIHLILIISNEYENGRMISAPTNTQKNIMTVIGQMKRWISKETGVSLWQKSYYEHIIRDENDYLSKTEYILNNPAKWLEKRSQNNG